MKMAPQILCETKPVDRLIQLLPSPSGQKQGVAEGGITFRDEEGELIYRKMKYEDAPLWMKKKSRKCVSRAGTRCSGVQR